MPLIPPLKFIHEFPRMFTNCSGLFPFVVLRVHSWIYWVGGVDGREFFNIRSISSHFVPFLRPYPRPPGFRRWPGEMELFLYRSHFVPFWPTPGVHPHPSLPPSRGKGVVLVGENFTTLTFCDIFGYFHTLHTGRGSGADLWSAPDQALNSWPLLTRLPGSSSCRQRRSGSGCRG